MKPGLYPNLTDEQYDAIDAVRSTWLKTLDSDTPAHLMQKISNPERKRCYDLGNAAHYGILRPDQFDKRFVVAGQCAAKTGKGERCTNAGKVELNGEWFCSVKGHAPADAAPSSRITLSEDDYRRASGMREAAFAHRRVRKILEAAEKEVTGVWEDAGTGLLCKFRADLAYWTGRSMADVKTTTRANQAAFSRVIDDLRYHLSAAFYVHGAAAVDQVIETFYFIPIEIEPPHGVNLFSLNDLALAKGAEMMRRALETYADCLEKNRWPCYSDEPKEIGLPDWKMRQLVAEQLYGGNQ